jgi:hypothetical protein
VTIGSKQSFCFGNVTVRQRLPPSVDTIVVQPCVAICDTATNTFGFVRLAAIQPSFRFSVSAPDARWLGPIEMRASAGAWACVT